LASNLTVIAFTSPNDVVLCRIDLTLKSGTTTVSGSLPRTTPYNRDPDFLMATGAIVADPTAAMLTAGELVAEVGFEMRKPMV